MTWIKAIVLAGVMLGTESATAQEAGWHYSPLPGEGDRAAMGCGYGATPVAYACLVVRCEDDVSVGLYNHTSLPGGDAGGWRLEFDDGAPSFDMTARAGSPYHARIEGDVTLILEAIKDGALVYLDPVAGAPIDRAISLSGSLYVVNQALYFCAPRVEPAN